MKVSSRMETTRHRSNESATGSDRVSTEVDSLKESFGQLRSDVMDLLSHAFGIGRGGAEIAKDRASDAVQNLKGHISDLKSHGADGLTAIERKIEEKPLQSALIAFGVGYVLAKVLGRR